MLTGVDVLKYINEILISIISIKGCCFEDSFMVSIVIFICII